MRGKAKCLKPSLLSAQAKLLWKDYTLSPKTRILAPLTASPFTSIMYDVCAFLQHHCWAHRPKLRSLRADVTTHAVITGRLSNAEMWRRQAIVRLSDSVIAVCLAWQCHISLGGVSKPRCQHSRTEWHRKAIIIFAFHLVLSFQVALPCRGDSKLTVKAWPQDT